MNRCGLESCVIGLWGSVRIKQEPNLVAVATNTCCITLGCVVPRNTLVYSSFPLHIRMTGDHIISLLASDDVLCSCHDNSSRRCSYYLCMNWSYGNRLWRLNLTRKRDKDRDPVCMYFYLISRYMTQQLFWWHHPTHLIWELTIWWLNHIDLHYAYDVKLDLLYNDRKRNV